MNSDEIWPTETRGGNGSAWLNRLLRVCKKSAIKGVTVIGGTAKIVDGWIIISMPPSGGIGGYQGEYDQTKSYSAGQEFKISTALTITISGTDHVIVAGLYGVRPAATAVDSQTFGPFAGNLPANPSTAGIDMDKFFFNPQLGMPSLGAAPNDKLYADLIVAYC